MMISLFNRIHFLFFICLILFISKCNSFYSPSLAQFQLTKPSSTVLMEGNKRVAVKFTSTRDGRRLIYERAKNLIKNTAMVMAFSNFGIKKNALDVFRKALPEGVIASVVKNGVFRRALDGTKWEPMQSTLKENNVYLFIPEGCFRAVYEQYKRWREENELVDPPFDIKFACVEGHLFEEKEKIEEILDIPTRKELMYRLGKAIHNIPTHLTRVLRKVPERLRHTLSMINQKMDSIEKQSGAEGQQLKLQELLAKVKAIEAAEKGTPVETATATATTK